MGAWVNKGGFMNNCLHLTQDTRGLLIAWADDLQTPGQVRYCMALSDQSG